MMERCGIAASQHTAHQNPHHPIIPDVRVRVAYTYPYQARRTIEILRRIHGARLRMNVSGTLVLYNCSTLFCFSFFFPHPIYIFALLFFLFLLVVTLMQGHIAGSSPPSPLRFVPCICIARRFKVFLPSSTRVELCLPTLRALSS